MSLKKPGNVTERRYLTMVDKRNLDIWPDFIAHYYMDNHKKTEDEDAFINKKDLPQTIIKHLSDVITYEEAEEVPVTSL